MRRIGWTPGRVFWAIMVVASVLGTLGFLPSAIRAGTPQLALLGGVAAAITFVGPFAFGYYASSIYRNGLLWGIFFVMNPLLAPLILLAMGPGTPKPKGEFNVNTDVGPRENLAQVEERVGRRLGW